ncbi:histidine kinase [Actinomadura sp. ATCC 31491]|uniref:histidine kinase n=1 Tax=Actinomadura luzonensis TaxID=2805427 RepID=A0ABT0G2T6_9ACTN|nr:sensor histidine kinase [Actinomadura luzonensis]MCK2218922.1 histidine kinase [Actinomadura luzonensis]
MSLRRHPRNPPPPPTDATPTASSAPDDGTPGPDEPDLNEPDSGAPDSSGPGSDGPDSDGPGSDGPDSDQPGSNQPGRERPGGDRPKEAPPSRWHKLTSATIRPFALALFRGDADPPPPRSRRLSLTVPPSLTGLIPLQTVSLVQLAELALALAMFGATQSMVLDLILRGSVPSSGPGPIAELFAYVNAVAAALPIALRDRWPLAAWRTAFALLPVALWTSIRAGANDPPYSAPTVLSYLLVLYSVAVRCDRRITLAVWVLTVLTAWIVQPDSMVIVTVAVTVVVLFGHNVRVRRTATSRLAEEERRSRLAQDAQAALQERARIARELHDVVAHHMSVIAIQAEAVPLKAKGDPAQLEAGLAEIRHLSLEAIAELRQVLGVLRDGEGRAETTPQPGLGRVDELVANARSAGLAVVVKRSGPLDGLGPAVGLSAYRIVQESLSNVMRHAPGAAVAIELAREGEELRLRVANGPGTAPGGPPGAGQGLVGMRERAALLGGALEAGPAPGGGFEVRARLPVTEESSR